MSQDKSRKDELYALALSARRSGANLLQRDKKAPDLGRPSVPTARDDLLSELFRSFSEEQRAIYRRLLESQT